MSAVFQQKANRNVSDTMTRNMFIEHIFIFELYKKRIGYRAFLFILNSRKSKFQFISQVIENAMREERLANQFTLKLNRVVREHQHDFNGSCF